MSNTCGIPSIDALYSGASSTPVIPGSDPAAVGAVQDLLSGHGFSGLPGLASSVYGQFGPKTSAALQSFQKAHGIDAQDVVDGPTLSSLVTTPATDPRASMVYAGLALGCDPSPLQKVLCLTAQMEGQGRFAAINLNTDKAGLSFGIIQWAQKPGRLPDILQAFRAGDAATYANIFGDGDGSLADALIAHVRKPNGGVDATGHTTDPAFDLTSDPWPARFAQAAKLASFQTIQVQTALAAFTHTLGMIRASVPEAVSERAVGFLLDVANQFGNGGMVGLCNSARRSGMSEADLLSAVADATVARMPAAIQTAVRNRRDGFLQTPHLSADPFAG